MLDGMSRYVKNTYLVGMNCVFIELQV